MDYAKICQKEGYRREDLSPEDRQTLSDIDYVIDQLGDLKANLELFDEEAGEDSIIGKMKQELYCRAIDASVERLKLAQMEVQIAMAERDCGDIIE